MPCSSMVSASSRFRKVVIGGSSILDAVGVRQLQAGRGLEPSERAALHLPAHEQQIELPQRVAGIVALQIVLGPEQALAAGLALAARDRAQRVEPARDRAEEALLGLHVGRDRPEQRRLRAGSCDGCGRGPGSPHRPASRVRADSGRAAACSSPTVRRGSCGRSRRRPRTPARASGRP